MMPPSRHHTARPDAAWRARKPAQKTSWGGYAGYFADPDGDLWEIAHNPFLAVGPQD